MRLEYIWAGLVVDQTTAEHMLLEYDGLPLFSDLLAAVMTLQQGPDADAQRALAGWTVMTMRWMPDSTPAPRPVCVLA